MRTYLARLSIFYRNWRIHRLEAKVRKFQAKLRNIRPTRPDTWAESYAKSFDAVAAGPISSGDLVETIPNGQVQAYAEEIVKEAARADFKTE